MTTPAYDLYLPQSPCTGVVFASPHSGRDYSDDFLHRSCLDSQRLRSSEDAFVDELVTAAPDLGAPLLTARTPRAYVDLNRSEDELDPALIDGMRRGSHNPRVSSGLGVIPRVVANGRAIYRGKISKIEAENRIARYWRPYHAALDALLAQQRANFGRAVLIDCHSMPHEAIDTYSSQANKVPEVVLGDRFGAAAQSDVMDAVELAFRNEGFRVSRNTPFAGAYISQRYGRPGIDQHVIQVEIDRSLYMHEPLLEKRTDFPHFQERITRVMAAIVQLAPGQTMPLAAE
ncbi:MAG: N-formylglutamate amidohydrolase [Mangrovicoccus sp.]